MGGTSITMHGANFPLAVIYLGISLVFRSQNESFPSQPNTHPLPLVEQYWPRRASILALIWSKLTNNRKNNLWNDWKISRLFFKNIPKSSYPRRKITLLCL